MTLVHAAAVRSTRSAAWVEAVAAQWLTASMHPAFAGRILDVDARVAAQAARLQVPDPRPTNDALIAATALVHELVVVTRSIRDFAGTGVLLLNPWQSTSIQEPAPHYAP